MLPTRSRTILIALSLFAMVTGRTEGSSVATPVLTASVTVDGETVDLSKYITQNTGSKYASLSADIFVNKNQIIVTGLYNPDPFISFGITTINAGPGPIAYSFAFGTPIVPGLYNTATSTGGVTVTNGASGTSTVANGGLYGPSYISGYGTVGASATNLGVDLGVGAVTATGVPFAVTNTKNFGFTSNTFPLKFYNNLEAVVSYTQTDVGSVASWSGAVTLNNAIPEPTSVIMLGMGTLFLGATHVLRRRVA